MYSLNELRHHFTSLLQQYNEFIESMSEKLSQRKGSLQTEEIQGLERLKRYRYLVKQKQLDLQAITEEDYFKNKNAYIKQLEQLIVPLDNQMKWFSNE